VLGVFLETQNGISRVTVVALVVAGAIVGGGAVEYWRSQQASTATAGQAAGGVDATEIERLKTLVPSQSHSMSDVGYHWTNLWFAGQQKNWPLAEFYFNETRQHILWTIRIRPIRKDDEKRDVDLKAIFDAVDATTFAAVKIAIAQKDSGKFTKAYTESLEGCYACHKASSKPYLHPVVPKAPAQEIIDFTPDPAVGS
jgi:hypothetical protein